MSGRSMDYEVSSSIANRSLFGKASRDVSTEAMHRLLTDGSFREAAQPLITQIVKNHLPEGGYTDVAMSLQKISPVFSRTGMSITTTLDVPRGQDKTLFPAVQRIVSKKSVQDEVGAAITRLLKDRLTNDMG